MDDTGIEPRKVAYKTDGKWQVTESELHFWWGIAIQLLIFTIQKRKSMLF